MLSTQITVIYVMARTEASAKRWKMTSREPIGIRVEGKGGGG